MSGNITRVNDRLLVWGIDGIEPNTISQACDTTRLPFLVSHTALMVDAHVGFGGPVGLVFPTDGAIVPSFVGVDIGCGMIALRTNLTLNDLPDSLAELFRKIEKAIPAGVGQGFDKYDYDVPRLYDMGLGAKEIEKASKQYGTLGSGNHFFELCADQFGNIWLVLHSGSRGIGNLLARKHIDGAKGLMRKYHIGIDPDLAYFAEGTAEFDAYIRDMLWAQDYAFGNREKMMLNALAALREVVPTVKVEQTINCHHNYSAKEHHHGRDIWITRKGAIRMREGDWGIIPGSMATGTYIVTGLGNAASFNSASHGAGRTMSRRAARENLSSASLTEAMQGKTWNANKANNLVDEHPGAYKDIASRMQAQSDLCQTEYVLNQLLNYKGA
jgi:tRNA-splicing ligase RtcB (3'-phosphate/5'-hydroxy nucleic acid ligase)